MTLLPFTPIPPRTMRTHSTLIILLLGLSLGGSHSVARAGNASISFARDVKPILASKCWNCHGPDAKTRKGDLRLDLRDDAEYVLESEDDAESELLNRITSNDPESQMPPAAAKSSSTLRSDVASPHRRAPSIFVRTGKAVGLSALSA